jgi:hypothetical protein
MTTQLALNLRPVVYVKIVEGNRNFIENLVFTNFRDIIGIWSILGYSTLHFEQVNRNPKKDIRLGRVDFKGD